MTADLKSKGPELLLDLIDKTAAVLVDMGGMDKETAHKCAEAVANRMRIDWGGQQIYFPKGLLVDITKRDLQLYQEFTGDNHQELVKKYNLSIQQVYRILKAVHAYEIARRQIDMFPNLD